MTYKVSYPHLWHPTQGTHYSQQVRITANPEELAKQGVRLAPGINYTDTVSFPAIIIALGLHKDRRVLFGRNSVIKYCPLP